MGRGGGGGDRVGGSGWGVRLDVNEEFVKIQKKTNYYLGRGVRGVGGQGGCEQRIEVFVKIQKKKLGVGGVGWGGRG